ncbi:MAG: nitrilase-related carbon-nitrogen hydrolase, partial [Paracoccaceae bacterium]|nr:nitrilase-related carbon-nitrogen hydrolase [Paracoccaceae bacterium]
NILRGSGGAKPPAPALRLGLWQGPSPAGDAQAALAALRTALDAAGAAGAAMLVAPEVFLPGYNHAEIPSLAQPRGGPWHQSLAGLCREAGCGLTVGYAEREGDRVYNSAVVFDAQGAEIAHYRKIQLYGPREKMLYTPGDAYCRFDLGGIPAALLICYDIEFAPHVAELAARGARLILVPTANMQPFTHVVRVTVATMAANHALAVVYANYCGQERDLTYVGGSQIVAADGAVLVLAGQGSALLIADLPAAIDPAHLSTQATDFLRIK